MIDITFVTNNVAKVAEVQKVLGRSFNIKHNQIDLDEIQAVNGIDVIKNKARNAYSILHNPVLVEDTSLYFNAWGGLPGALIKWFLNTVGCEGICKMMKDEDDRAIYAESAFAYFDGKEMKVETGRIDGVIPDKPRGTQGFGWDPIFLPDGSNKTYGEMNIEEKNKVSMRVVALKKLKHGLYNK